MKFLEIVHREGAIEDDWADPGEQAIPNFPTGARNTFLGTTSFKPAPYAQVVNVRHLDLDEIATELKGRYKSLPDSVLDAYVLETAKFVQSLAPGTLCQCYTADDGEKVTVRAVKTGEVYTLWEQQPIPRSYR